MARFGHTQLAGGVGSRGGLAFSSRRTKHYSRRANSIVGRISSGPSRTIVGSSHARPYFGLGPHAHTHQLVGRARRF